MFCYLEQLPEENVVKCSTDFYYFFWKLFHIALTLSAYHHMSTMSRSAPPFAKLVNKLTFQVMSPDDIKSSAVVEITEHDCFKGKSPKPNGPMDPAMGPSEKNEKCVTCGNTMKDCPGHIGYMEFAEPLYHVGFMLHVLNILKCVCMGCSRLMVDKNSTDFKVFINRGNNRNFATCMPGLFKLTKKHKICDVSSHKGGKDQKNSVKDRYSTTAIRSPTDVAKVCPPLICTNHRPKVAIKDAFTVIVDIGKHYPITFGVPGTLHYFELPSTETKFELKPWMCVQILSKISDADCAIMGIPENSRPEWMVPRVIAIPPICIRIGHEISHDGTKDDEDMTYKISEMSKHNIEVKNMSRGLKHAKDKNEKFADVGKSSKLGEVGKNGKSGEDIYDVHVKMLQYHYATYLDNELPGITQATQRTNRPIKGLRQRLKGKHGRFRCNLSGKRGDHTARAVISPDPNVPVDCVGVPASIAATLTVEQPVNDLMLHELQELVWRGPNVMGGATHVIFPNGNNIDLRMVDPKSVIIEPNCVILRHIKDGDYLIMNRQPSLHGPSMMGHKIKIINFSTFRLNLSATTPYNADFVSFTPL